MSGMNDALCPLKMNVVSANAASPSGAGSAAGTNSTTVGRARSSVRTAMTTSSVAGPPGLIPRDPDLDRNPFWATNRYHAEIPGEEAITPDVKVTRPQGARSYG